MKTIQWLKGTINIAGDSIVLVLQPNLQSQKHNVKLKDFSDAYVRDVQDNSSNKFASANDRNLQVY